MQHLNEATLRLRHCLLALGKPTKSGNYLIDLLLANACVQAERPCQSPYEIVRLAEDIAGGLVVTAPSEIDLRDPKIGPMSINTSKRIIIDGKPA